MKNALILLLTFITALSFSQTTNPDSYKALYESRNKSDINLYYNPLLDYYDLHFVKLDLEVSDETTFIQGNVSLHANVVHTLDTIILNFSNCMTVDSVFINDLKTSVSHNNNHLQYIFETPRAINDHIKVQVFYRGTPCGYGVTNAKNFSWDKNVTWTLSESFHAYEWWPCKQVLSDKIDSAYVFLTCDDDLKAGSNGLLTKEVNLPDNKKRFEWKTNYPINYYLISYAVSEYEDYSIYAYPEGSDSILIQNYIYNSAGCLDFYKTGIDKTTELIELYSDKFGLYPFASEKYGHCIAELGGGMEHQTMSTMANFRFYLVAHELGHMWFGDYVTCASWQDIWINEGFASYTEYIALENLVSKSDADNWMKSAHTYALAEPSGSVYIPFEEAGYESRIFSYALSYKKGAALVHMIRHEINDDELFFVCLKNYLAEFAHSVASGDDFKNSLEKNTGLDFDPFFDQWYYGKGFPRFIAEYTQLNDTLFLNVNQYTSSSETPLFQIHVEYKITFADGDTLLRILHSKNIENYIIPLSRKITSIEIDPENRILKEYGIVDSVNAPGSNSSLYKMYPNPANNIVQIIFNLALHNKLKYVQFFDLNGKLIKFEKTHSDYLSVDISGFNSGLYFIKVISSGNSYSGKLIKQ
ncbi:MAG: T9SS type A sorting domain-containing protein [Bacteroidales bacterium]|nr:T9SS type A sorting domain-containing protein [Bacteroidales bacterium]